MTIADEAATAAANAMAQVIQKATATDTGDIAGQFFSPPEMLALKQTAQRLKAVL